MRSWPVGFLPVAILVGAWACGDDPDSAKPASGTDTPDASLDAGPSVTDATGPAEATDGGDAGKDAEVDATIPAPRWGVDLGLALVNAAASDATQNVAAVGLLGGKAYIAKLDPAGSPLWNKVFGTSSVKGTNQFYSAAFDAGGNLVVCGVAGEQITIQAGTTIDAGAFVAKFDPAGNLIWVYGAFAGASFTKVAVRANGNVVVAGALSGAADFGDGNLTTKGGRDVLFVELTAAKALVRAKSWGDVGEQTPTALAVDDTGNTFLAGRFAGQLDFGGGAMTGPSPPTSSANVFLVKLDATGAYAHQREAKTSSIENRLDAIATTKTGGLYAGGLLAAEVMDLGGGNLTTAGSFDGVIALYDANLGHVWSKRFGSNTGESVSALAVGADDTAFVTGPYNNPFDLGTGLVPGPDGFYVARIGATNSTLAAFGSGSGSSSKTAPFGITFLGGDDVAVAGRFAGPIALPSGMLTPAQALPSTFVARFPVTPL